MFPFPAGSGNSTDAADAQHYGSMYTMADYETNAQNVYITIAGTPAKKLRVTSTIVYNKSTAEYDRVVMPDVSDYLNGALSHQDFEFDEMHEYSNLDYSLLQFSLGFEYALASDLTFTIDGDYADMTDDAGYVYGVESGSIFMIRTGFRIEM